MQSISMQSLSTYWLRNHVVNFHSISCPPSQILHSLSSPIANQLPGFLLPQHPCPCASHRSLTDPAFLLAVDPLSSSPQACPHSFLSVSNAQKCILPWISTTTPHKDSQVFPTKQHTPTTHVRSREGLKNQGMKHHAKRQDINIQNHNHFKPRCLHTRIKVQSITANIMCLLQHYCNMSGEMKQLKHKTRTSKQLSMSIFKVLKDDMNEYINEVYENTLRRMKQRTQFKTLWWKWNH